MSGGVGLSDSPSPHHQADGAAILAAAFALPPPTIAPRFHPYGRAQPKPAAAQTLYQPPGWRTQSQPSGAPRPNGFRSAAPPESLKEPSITKRLYAGDKHTFSGMDENVVSAYYSAAHCQL